MFWPSFVHGLKPDLVSVVIRLMVLVEFEKHLRIIRCKVTNWVAPFTFEWWNSLNNGMRTGVFLRVLPLVGVASWLVHSSLDRAVRVRALARDIVLCSWARHFTLTVPLSTQEYKWVPANCWGNLTDSNVIFSLIKLIFF